LDLTSVIVFLWNFWPMTHHNLLQSLLGGKPVGELLILIESKVFVFLSLLLPTSVTFSVILARCMQKHYRSAISQAVFSCRNLEFGATVARSFLFGK